MYVKLASGSMEKLRGTNLLCFGAGSMGERSIEECEKINANILGFIDNDKKRWGTLWKGYQIYAPEDIKNFPDAYVLITSAYAGEIQQQLADMGIDKVETICLGALRDKIPQKDFFKPFLNKEQANEYLYQCLNADKPFFAGRLGSNELECMVEYYYLLNRENGGNDAYHDNLKLFMKQGAGFYPTEDAYLDRFVQLYTENLKQLDLVWCMWLSRFENQLYERFIPQVPISIYYDLVLPFHITKPWTKALEKKKVLVIHPFEDSIIENYAVRDKLFDNPDLLPEFQLLTLKAVQSLGDEMPEYNTWFDALEYMKNKIARMDFDIALIGAGAYGFPLGAYIKEIGKKAVHIGGRLQILFGIKGRGWDDWGIYNDYWKSPKESEKPKGYKSVEAGRFW